MPSRLFESPQPVLCAVLYCALLYTIWPSLAVAQAPAFETIEEAPAIQLRIIEARQLGNAEEAWNLEQGLVSLALRSPDDLRSARILRDVGDNRVDTLARYDAGEFPDELVLGCYYMNSNQYAEAERRGSQPIASGSADNIDRSSCGNGSSSQLRRALTAEALWFYVEAARLTVSNEEAGDGEIQDVLMKVLATSYRNRNYRTGLLSLQSLLANQEEKSEPWVTQARTLALIGDWDMLFAEHFGTKYVDSGIATYERALALLTENSVPEAAVDAIFAPQVPVRLPTFFTSPLLSQQTPEAGEFVDVRFEIEDSGKSSRIEILESSENLTRAELRDLENTIKRSRFRPIARNGRILESAPVTVRYYLSE